MVRAISPSSLAPSDQRCAPTILCTKQMGLEPQVERALRMAILLGEGGRGGFDRQLAKVITNSTWELTEIMLPLASDGSQGREIVCRKVYGYVALLDLAYEDWMVFKLTPASVQALQDAYAALQPPWQDAGDNLQAVAAFGEMMKAYKCSTHRAALSGLRAHGMSCPEEGMAERVRAEMVALLTMG